MQPSAARTQGYRVPSLKYRPVSSRVGHSRRELPIGSVFVTQGLNPPQVLQLQVSRGFAPARLRAWRVARYSMPVIERCAHGDGHIRTRRAGSGSAAAWRETAAERARRSGRRWRRGGATHLDRASMRAAGPWDFVPPGPTGLQPVVLAVAARVIRLLPWRRRR